MTNLTPYLGLTTFNSPDDNTEFVYTYVNTVSGSSAGTNLPIIDKILGETNASAISLNTTGCVVVLEATPTLQHSKILTGGSAIEISTGSNVVTLAVKSSSPIYVTPAGNLGLATNSTLSGSSGSLTMQSLGAAVVGNWNNVDVDEFGRVTAGYSVAGGLITELKFENAAVPVAPVSGCSIIYFDTSGSLHAFNSGSNINLTNAAMQSPYQNFDRKGDLWIASGSKSGSTLAVGTNKDFIVADSATGGGMKWIPQVRNCYLGLNQTVQLNSAMMNTITIPTDMDGWILTKVVATSGSSTSGSPVFSVKSASSITISGSQNMLTVNPTIGEKAYSSETGTGSVSAVIDAAYQTVQAGNTVWVGVGSASTTGSWVYWSGITLTFQNRA